MNYKLSSKNIRNNPDLDDSEDGLWLIDIKKNNSMIDILLNLRDRLERNKKTFFVLKLGLLRLLRRQIR